jgi:hypothetical protein
MTANSAFVYFVVKQNRLRAEIEIVTEAYFLLIPLRILTNTEDKA